jgi:hypothetical protein
MLTLLGTLIVVTFTAWLSTRSVHATIDALRHETRADLAGMRATIAEVKGELKLDILRMENKLDHYRRNAGEPQRAH